MATATTKSIARPAKDEWGVYDPQQAGLAALYARLDDSKETKTISPMSSLSRKPAQVPVKAAAAPAVKAAEKKTEAAPARPTLRDAK
jgi:hypothetical protein